ncbi:helix-turn-helix domain-containing protein [Lactobacillus johnsonii]|uniref:HTH cro/C1-type domain-containing protein n=1 Tax=Lactobacillus johnsonii TaxID=33959 RepID=A0A9X0LYK8_LACJH|nr:helix-turn-helix transcriptional regulator [Lactobacillus johnsonii]KXN76907.1 hypothetical protein AYJ53_07525 [Lactobacillus johnsonii]
MNRIKILRLVNNKTQKDLAKYLNVSKQAIVYYEQGKRNPKPENWQALADYFNVSVPYLRGATTYEVLDSAEKDIYNYVIEAMDRAFNDCALLPVQQERILKAIAYSIDNGELN